MQVIEVPAFAENLAFDSLNLHLNLKHIIVSQNLFIKGEQFCGVTFISLAAYAFLSRCPAHPICLIHRYLHPCLFFKHWHSFILELW